ncbi:NAD(P)H-quinone oxidoreductase subunit N chloroplastic [Zea mays]|uniref:NAD(P)H-quinone oxidoreductase subunit N chloroplastic n=1 Tax=Zea mays TaxID=4577 RepID=A0A1D6N5I0_MAIZE|nr:NAD(P)H-quinone oxidoreductase subunit N chloroplastic [Zea mays]
MWSAATAAAARAVSVSPVPAPSLLSGRRGGSRGGRGSVSVRSTVWDFVGGDLPSLGRQPVARWYFPPEVDYRLSLLHPDAKGLVVWIIEAKVLSKAELQFLAMLPDIRPKVRVIAECGNWRSFVWKPLKQIAGLEPDPDAEE